MKPEKNKKEKDSKEKLKKIIESLTKEVMEEQLLKEAGGPVGAFLDPLSDIVKTAKYGLKKVATVGGRNALKIAGHAVMLLIPFIDSKEIKKIDKMVQGQIDKRVAQLDNEYKDVLQRNMQALQSKDISAFTFFLNPAVYFGAKAGMSAAATAASMFETMTMGSKAATDLRKKVDGVNTTNIGWGGGGGGGRPSGGGGGMGPGDFGGDYGGDLGGMYEAAVAQAPVAQAPVAQAPVAQAPVAKTNVNNEELLNKQVANEIARLLKSPEIQQAIKNNPIVKIVDGSKVAAITNRASQLMKINSYEDLKNFMGEDFTQFQDQISKNAPKNLKPEELKAYNESTVPELKKAYKEVYSKYLSAMLNTASNPEEINKAIQFVNNLG